MISLRDLAESIGVHNENSVFRYAEILGFRKEKDGRGLVFHGEDDWRISQEDAEAFRAAFREYVDGQKEKLEGKGLGSLT